jgi:hypothetical protein
LSKIKIKIMEKGSIFVWVCLGVVGILSIFAMAFAGYTYTQTQQGGSINVRSINLGTRTITESGTTGSAASGTVVATGTYDIQLAYSRPGIGGVFTTTATVGTYTYKYILDSSGSFKTFVLEVSPMTYTFTAYPSVTLNNLLFLNFTPYPGVLGGSAYMCSPYVVRQNNGVADVTYTSVSTGSAGGGLSIVFAIPTNPSITSGYTISTLQSIKIVAGEIVA